MGRLVVAIVVSLWAVPIAILVNRIVPQPYMDEIFHVPQAQKYCKGDFKSWDPMITTPPGLYFLSLAHVASLFPGMILAHQALSVSEMCSTVILRSLNCLLAVICGILLYEIIIEVQPTISRRRATFCAAVLALYPINWFFTYLYYTDVASLAIFLSMHLTCLKRVYWLSASLGALAITVRQTNIIWMLFVACNGVIDLTIAHEKSHWMVDNFQTSTSKKNPTHVAGIAAKPSLRKRKPRGGILSTADRSESRNSYNSRSDNRGFLNEIQHLLSKSWDLKWDLLINFSPFLFIVAAFAVLVYWNGGIVLGAKEAHTVSPHLAQMMYFSAVSCLASAPFHFTVGQAAALLRWLWKNKPLSFCVGAIALFLSVLSIHFFSIAHPYLLADNRHYTFYLWRKVIHRHWSMKYLMVPVYVYSWASICEKLGKGQKRIWVLAYVLACAAALVPAPLIEFRYYTIPFYILMVHSRSLDEEWWKWVMLGVLYVGVNVFTMFMFLFRPFNWEHEPGTQRFIW